MMMVLAVSAAPKNVPTWDPETVAEFNSQQQQQQGSKRSLQEAVHQWLNPDKVPSLSPPCASLFHSSCTSPVCGLPVSCPAFVVVLDCVGCRLCCVYRSLTRVGKAGLCIRLPQLASPRRPRPLQTQTTQPRRRDSRRKCLWLRKGLENHRREEIWTRPQELDPPGETHTGRKKLFSRKGIMGSDGWVARVGIRFEKVKR